MADMGVTETNATALAAIAQMVQLELTNEAKLIHTISDYSGLVKKGDKSVSFPRSGSFTAQDKVENTQGTNQALTYAVDTLNLTSHKHVPVRLEDIASMQSVVDLEADLIQKQASAIVRAFESSIYTALALCSESAPDHVIQGSGVTTSGFVLSEADFTEARRLLNVQNVPLSDRFCAIHPDEEKDCLAIANFIQQDRYAGNEAIMNGELGKAYGFKIIVTTAVASGSPVFYHKSHVAFAAQQAPKWERMRAPLGWLADDYEMSMLYGVKTLDSGKRGVLFNNDGTI